MGRLLPAQACICKRIGTSVRLFVNPLIEALGGVFMECCVMLVIV